MRLSYIVFLLASLSLSLLDCSAPKESDRIVLGDERFEEYVPLIKGKKVAVFSNHTGIVGDKVTESGYGPHLVDALISKGINVQAIFSPEHGFRGTADAGEKVNGEVDEKTGVEIISLYGGGGGDPYGKTNMDKFDVLLVDIQDVGLRYYTYYITMLHLMDSCAEFGKEVIVLDRPNPNGFYVDGPILDPEYKSGVGALPITTVHGMTLGELALMINGEGWLKDGLKCDLKVIPCLGYDHSMKPQLVVPPSPNLKTMRAIYLYASTCYFEGTVVSLGRGTDNPFEVFGHPDISAPFSFTPKSVPGAKNPPLKDQLCHGYDLREKPMEDIWNEGINLDYVITAYKDLGIGDKIFTRFFDLLAGVGYIREMIIAGASAEEIKARWKDDVEAFRARRKPYLLYDDPGSPSIPISSASSAAPVGADGPVSVAFSDEAGAYPDRSKQISLLYPQGYKVYYTTDGSLPTTESSLYNGPIVLKKKGNRWVNSNTVKQMAIEYQGKPLHPVAISKSLPTANIIRAVAVAPDGTAGDVVTKTYFIGADLKKKYNDAMVISIVTAPDNLLDYEKGILVTGRLYDEWKTTDEADSLFKTHRFWELQGNHTMKGKAWERPASVELFDRSNTLTLQREAGIRLKGRASRMYAQKSFNINIKDHGGNSTIIYPLFPDALNANTGEVITRYESFSLRNGGNDAEYLKFKDSWIQSRVRDRDYSTQKNRIAVLFLNGEYWGHYSLIEKIDNQFLENHYGVKDLIAIKELELNEGKPSDFHLFEELLSFSDRDLSISSNWEEFKSVMDVQSMADYYATEIYIANRDWRDDANKELWRSVNTDPSNPYADGRWRYILCDVEFSSSLYNTRESSYDFNSFDYALKNHRLFASVIKNPEFKRLFKDAMTDIALKNFDPQEVKSDLEQWAGEWKPYMPYYYKRFGNTSYGWKKNLKSTATFFQERYSHILPALEN